MNHKISTSDPMRHQDIEHNRLEQGHHGRLYSIEDEEMKESGEGEETRSREEPDIYVVEVKMEQRDLTESIEHFGQMDEPQEVDQHGARPWHQR
jgi:hypothetical protein